MLDSFVKSCQAHGVISPTRMLMYCEKAVQDKVAELPKAARAVAYECILREALSKTLGLTVCKSELAGNTTAAVYIAAALFNELSAARAALSEANATLIANNLNPIGESDADA